MEDLDFIQFMKKLNDKTNIDLTQYKEAQMKRRLTTLRTKNGYSTFVSYWDALCKDSRLMDEFLDRMTINVSEFWRNPNRWEVLEKKFFPEMLRANGGRLKVWSAACSTGEEPYTLAMILAKLGGERSTILATDIDQIVLRKAEIGNYIDRAIRDVPASYQSQYFTKNGDGTFDIALSLKKMIKFQQGNLLHDRFDSGFDLIVCRNVMIYFTDEAKSVLYTKFAQALKPGGLLFVGSTEQIFTPNQHDLETAETFFYRRV